MPADVPCLLPRLDSRKRRSPEVAATNAEPRRVDGPPEIVLNRQWCAGGVEACPVIHDETAVAHGHWSNQSRRLTAPESLNSPVIDPPLPHHALRTRMGHGRSPDNRGWREVDVYGLPGDHDLRRTHHGPRDRKSRLAIVARRRAVKIELTCRIAPSQNRNSPSPPRPERPLVTDRERLSMVVAIQRNQRGALAQLTRGCGSSRFYSGHGKGRKEQAYQNHQNCDRDQDLCQRERPLPSPPANPRPALALTKTVRPRHG